jgi:hypothetical protein
MSINKHCIALILFFFITSIAHSQNACADACAAPNTEMDSVNADTLVRVNKCYQNIEVHFKFDKYNLELDYMGNNTSLQNFAKVIDSIGISNIDSIVVISQSSPEGVYEHNLMLSRNRANTIRKYLLNQHPELDEILHVYPDGESWSQLREYVKKDTLMKQSTIDKVISVIDADVNIGTKKWRMEQLPIYKYLRSTYYPKIRNSAIYILYYSEIVPVAAKQKSAADIKSIAETESVKAESTVVAGPVLGDESIADKESVTDSESVVDAESVIDTKPSDTAKVAQDTSSVAKSNSVKEDDWTRKLHVKTNAIGLGLGIANVAPEIDIAKHLSFTLPVYYSAWNYFKTTIKFRTLAVQPELRYWISPDNEGFFAGAHFGLAYYNFAADGDYRYQDHNGKKPAIGGGLSIGYVLPISDNNRWRIEFSLGAGVYAVHYDKFFNTPNTKEGLMIDSGKMTYWGIDQAAISFVYTFNLKKKGDRR